MPTNRAGRRFPLGLSRSKARKRSIKRERCENPISFIRGFLPSLTSTSELDLITRLVMTTIVTPPLCRSPLSLSRLSSKTRTRIARGGTRDLFVAFVRLLRYLLDRQAPLRTLNYSHVTLRRTVYLAWYRKCETISSHAVKETFIRCT